MERTSLAQNCSQFGGLLSGFRIITITRHFGETEHNFYLCVGLPMFSGSLILPPLLGSHLVTSLRPKINARVFQVMVYIFIDDYTVIFTHYLCLGHEAEHCLLFDVIRLSYLPVITTGFVVNQIFSIII
jgi:hypothetical protein